MSRRPPSPPEEALRAPVHLACVEGPDVGAVASLASAVVLGRDGGLAVTDPRASRRHARIVPLMETPGSRTAARRRRRRPAVAQVQDLGSANGTRVRRRGLPARWTRRLPATGGGSRLRVGDQVIVGSDRFEVRARPRALSWPAPAAGRSPGRAARTAVLPIVMTAAFLAWRIGAVASRIPGPAAAAAAVALVGSGAALALWLRRRRNRRWADRDPAALALIVAALSSPTGGHGDRRRESDRAASVWPGRAGSRDALDLDLDLDGRPARDGAVASPGAVGPGARAAARWWCAQLAARTGGATVHEDGAAPRVLGDGRLRIHVVAGAQCPMCRDLTRPTEAEGADPRGAGRILHVGVASSWSDLPRWCDRVVRYERPPVSALWWEQIAAPAAERATGPGGPPPDVVLFEERLREGDPPVDDGPPGSLRVVLGRDGDGPVAVDLVGDGPHAMIAGTTGAGKSEALTTWLIALCERHPPDALRLVLVDYKGGAAFAPLSRLPHTETVLTDLDPAATDRAIRGLRALLARRERELADLGLPDLARWQLHSARGLAPTAPARIVVAVDEFRALAESHPHTLEALVRLASQGRSLGVHLMVATQKPAGALTPAMRANIEARLALRCLDPSDSLDILGTAEAARLPRRPGRAVLRGRGALQVAWIPDLGPALERIAARWDGAGTAATRAPLWAAELPARVDGTATGPAPEGAVVVGLIDGIDVGAHIPLVWAGGSLRLEGPQHVAGALARAALALGTRISAGRGITLHLCAADPDPTDSPDPTDGPGSRLAVDDAGACALLLAELADHGPAVLVVDDAETMVRALDLALGPGRGRALWERLLSRSDRAGVVIVAATPGQWAGGAAGSSAFAWRLACPADAHDALKAGLPSTAPPCRVPGRMLLVRRPGPGAPGGNATRDLPVCQLPLDPEPLWARAPDAGRRAGRGPAEARPWRVVSLDDPRIALAEAPSGTVARAGPGLDPRAVRPGQAWLVVADRPGPAERAIARAHREAGLPPPDIEVLPGHRWPQILQVLRGDDRAVLALRPDADVLRALAQRARSQDPALTAEHYASDSGVLLDRGHLERMVLVGA